MDGKSIEEKRNSIRDHMLNNYFDNPMLNLFTDQDLYVLYQLYDQSFFNFKLNQNLLIKKRTIKFSNTSKNTVGLHSLCENVHTISISSNMICNLFNNNEKCLTANGLIITDRLGALMNIFEHELIHLYCSLNEYTRKITKGPGKMYYSSHGKLFQKFVFEYFGHTDFYHNFNAGDATNHITKNDCKEGMSIYFNHKKTKICGKIIKMNPKRCRISSDSGNYDVPYSMIRIS